MNSRIKQWLIDNCGVKEDATDDEFQKALGTALATGQLGVDEYAELTADKAVEQANVFGQQLTAIGDGIKELTVLLAPKQEEPKEKEPKEEPKAKETPKEEPKSVEWHQKMTKLMGTGTPVDPSGNVRVKGAWEAYDDTKSLLTYPGSTKSGKKHPFAGRPVVDFAEGGRQMDEPSDRDKAVAGAYAKLMCSIAHKGSRTMGFQTLPDHDKELIYLNWGGASDGGDFADIKNRRLTPSEQKAIIDDATSGGTEAAPIVFDDMVIQAPLLHGELFPLVNTVPLDRGRRVEGVATGTVTGAWGGIDDTAITLFTTTSYVTAFDTTVFRWEGAIQIGLDFMSDTPIDFGAHVTAQYGERLLEDLDDVIATGNGTTQPEGVMNKTGITTVAWGAATSIGNYESTRFGVAKAEHRANVLQSAVFCGTETSYQRALALPVGAADNRRLFGTGTVGGTNSYDDYAIMQRPYKINESLTNAQIFYAILGRYRMYRRRGFTLRSSTEGDTLIRQNELLIVAMARYGGQLERAAAGAITTTAPA
jgi:HK97 family phage major capsid protein